MDEDDRSSQDSGVMEMSPNEYEKACEDELAKPRVVLVIGNRDQGKSTLLRHAEQVFSEADAAKQVLMARADPAGIRSHVACLGMAVSGWPKVVAEVTAFGFEKILEEKGRSLDPDIRERLFSLICAIVESSNNAFEDLIRTDSTYSAKKLPETRSTPAKLLQPCPESMNPTSDQYVGYLHEAGQEAQNVLKQKICENLNRSSIGTWTPYDDGKSSGFLEFPPLWCDRCFDPGLKNIDQLAHVDYRHVLDYSRILIEFQTCERLIHGYHQISNIFGAENILEIDNQFKSPSILGWRNLNLLVRIPISDDRMFISEIRLQHSRISEAKRAVAPQYLEVLSIFREFLDDPAEHHKAMRPPLLEILRTLKSRANGYAEVSENFEATRNLLTLTPKMAEYSTDFRDVGIHLPQVLDHFRHFEPKLQEIISDSYVPDAIDYLRHHRFDLEGIESSVMTVSSKHHLVIRDGGFDQELWPSKVQGVTDVMILVSIIDYNLIDIENPSRNRMVENLLLAASVTSNTSNFASCPIWIVFTRIDLLPMKMKHYPIQSIEHFRDFSGDSPGDAIEFFISKIRQEIPHEREQPVRLGTLCTLDPASVRSLFEELVI